ncbi:hypothetical protein [Pseudoalteromonas 'SMAR']|uniref:hypothetical protein n=1 Tax=Pseudoalteromonas 'SMAR' TaxID=3416908 RepID=UPI003AF30DEA
MKLLPYLCTALAAFSASLAATEVPEPAMKREVAIFERVLSSALKHDTQDQLVAVSGYYLRQQGVIFNLSLKQRHSLPWLGEIDSIHTMAAIGEFDLPEFDINIAEAEIAEPIAEAFSEAYSAAAEQVQHSAEKVREAIAQERENRIKLRELEREKAELEFAQRHNTEQQADALDQALEKIEQQIAQLAQRGDKLEAVKEQLKSHLEASRAQREEQQKRKQQAFQEQLQQSIARSLCDYGGGLRSLPNDEHISFVYASISEPQQKQILIYRKQQVEQCVQGKITASDIIDAAEQYQF